jgi:hypothetical protein
MFKFKFYKLHAEEEPYWYKRAHGRWLLKGDLNIAYFRRIANGTKRKKNTIQSLESDGVLVEGTVNLLNIAIDYYKEIFGPALENLFQLSHDLWGPL